MSVCMTLEDDIDISRGDMIVRENNQPKWFFLGSVVQKLKKKHYILVSFSKRTITRNVARRRSLLKCCLARRRRRRCSNGATTGNPTMGF